MGNFFEWDQAKYSVEVPRMDGEHQAIIASMNKLFSLSESGAATAQLGKAFAELVQLTVKHFADEEAYMESIHFADLGKHKLIHKTLLASVMSHKKKFDDAGNSNAISSISSGCG